MKKLGTLLWLAFSAVCSSAAGLDAKVEAIHNELRSLRDAVLDAVNKGDLERELTFLHTNVVVTWHDAEVSRGRSGVRDYYQRLTGGPQQHVAKFSAEITVDELTILHGDSTGIAFGRSLEHFQFKNGRNLDVNGRWTATLVREEGPSTGSERGRWLIASLHLSTNLFDNVILSLSQKSLLRLAGVASVVGLVCGWFIGRAIKRRA